MAIIAFGGTASAQVPEAIAAPGESSLVTVHAEGAQIYECKAASDGKLGHVCDFMMDSQNWAICQLVIKTGHRFSGKEVQIPTSVVQRISYEESTVFVNLTTEAVEHSPAHHLDLVGAAD